MDGGAETPALTTIMEVWAVVLPSASPAWPTSAAR